MRSITLKLTLAFLVVTFTVAGLAAVFARSALIREFDRLVIGQAQENFIADVVVYYETNGSWEGVQRLFPPPSQPANTQPPATSPTGRSRPRSNALPPPFVLVDSNGVVRVGGGPDYRRDDVVSVDELENSTPIEVEGEIIGYVFHAGPVPELTLEEERYLQSINDALVLAAVGSSIIALIVGVVLARSLTRPIRELTTASQAMAQGHLGQHVPVRSKDELGELAASFNQMSADLEYANQSRRQMTADIAHDLRTPLTVLSGYLESMREGYLEPTTERLDLMFDEVQRLNRLVNDLRTLSLADAGELSLHLQPTAPAQLLERVAAIYRHQAEQQNISLSVEADPALPDLEVDPERMVQVLGNLISNALRYTPEGDEINLRAQTHGPDIELAVQDTGAGIPPEAVEHIFDRFYRADSSRQVASGESGLGLAIVKSIVEEHGGSITVESTLGEGTKFVILMPTT